MSDATDSPTKLDPWDDHDLREVEVWSVATLARLRALAPLMDAVRKRGGGPRRHEAVLMIADAAFAMIALFLSLDAVRRYRLSHVGLDGPLPDVELTSLWARAKDARNAVLHFDDKVSRSPSAQLAINATEGITVTAPPGKTGTADVMVQIAWTEMEGAARATLRWLGDIEAPLT